VRAGHTLPVTPQSLADLQTVLADFIKNPLDKSNLPGFANPLCEADPNSAQCLAK
jgi:hypothetical protein